MVSGGCVFLWARYRLEDLVVAVVDDLDDASELLAGKLVHVVAQLSRI